MSGHSGFQAIGNHLPPVGPNPQIGAAEGSGQPQPVVPVANGSAQEPEVLQPNARSLAQKLDAMVLQAAKLSTRVVGGDSFNPR